MTENALVKLYCIVGDFYQQGERNYVIWFYFSYKTRPSFFTVFSSVFVRLQNQYTFSFAKVIIRTMQEFRKLPIGIQSFENLREDGYIYVDKTQYVYNLVHTGKVYFLSRPRRFGKSLFLTTLKAYFEGKKELFTGLALGKLEKDWIEYPVIYFNFAQDGYSTDESLNAKLNYIL